jgi:hypothetical protein
LHFVRETPSAHGPPSRRLRIVGLLLLPCAMSSECVFAVPEVST